MVSADDLLDDPQADAPTAQQESIGIRLVR
jgi:hypothetical protein